MNNEAKILFKMILPDIYLNFVQLCKTSFPAWLLGTDFAFTKNELKEQAKDLLEQNEVNNFLTEDDFVFFMHQGYVFGFFKADGNTDPDVYIYSEVDKQKRNAGLLSQYLKTEF